jgi:hypothetical protein
VLIDVLNGLDCMGYIVWAWMGWGMDRGIDRVKGSMVLVSYFLLCV